MRARLLLLRVPAPVLLPLCGVPPSVVLRVPAPAPSAPLGDSLCYCPVVDLPGVSPIRFHHYHSLQWRLGLLGPCGLLRAEGGVNFMFGVCCLVCGRRVIIDFEIVDGCNSGFRKTPAVNVILHISRHPADATDRVRTHGADI